MTDCSDSSNQVLHDDALGNYDNRNTDVDKVVFAHTGQGPSSARRPLYEFDDLIEENVF